MVLVGDGEEWRRAWLALLHPRRHNLHSVFSNGGGGLGIDLCARLHAGIGIHFHLIHLRIDCPCRFGCVGRLCCQLSLGGDNGSIEGGRDGSRDGSREDRFRRGSCILHCRRR